MQAATRQDLLPDLCKPARLVSIMVIVQLLVVVVLAASSEQPWWQRIGPLTLFCQWLALSYTAVLCQCRTWFNRRPTWLSSLLITAMVGLFTLLATRLVSWLDLTLAWGVLEHGRDPAGRAWANSLIAMSVALLALRYFYLLGRWQQLTRVEADSRLSALQARIRPHFLFNSMNSIAALIRIDPLRAERAVETLADLVRASLATARQKTSTLAEELELVRGYLELEQLRLGERLQVRWQQPDSLPDTTPVPSLLIQPLVENAITHGIANRPEGGLVEISLHCDPGHISARISNPMPSQSDDRLSGGHGMALENIRARLHHFWDGGAHLHCQNDGDRYVVTLVWPRQSAHGN